MSRFLAISMRLTEEPAYRETRDAIAQDWWPFLATALPESVPLLLPNDEATTLRILEKADPHGLILTGGNDVGSCPSRDRNEATALSWMLARQRPVLGVCRGMQFLARQLGGTLAPLTGHAGTRHQVCFSGPVAGFFGEMRREVNSYHGIKVLPEPADGLEVWGRAEDGTAEAIRGIHLPVLGIMWHPERERPFHPLDLALFADQFYRTGGPL